MSALVTVEDVLHATGRAVTVEDITAGQGFAEAWCRRRFDLAERTEEHDLQSGRAFPQTTPVFEVTRVETDDGEPLPFATLLDGSVRVVDSDDPVMVTYSGGWTRDNLPADLRHAVALLAVGVSELPIDGLPGISKGITDRNPAVLDAVAADGPYTAELLDPWCCD